MPFRDAGRGRGDFDLSISDVLYGMYKALKLGLVVSRVSPAHLVRQLIGPCCRTWKSSTPRSTSITSESSAS